MHKAVIISGAFLDLTLKYGISGYLGELMTISSLGWDKQQRKLSFDSFSKFGTIQKVTKVAL